MAIKRKKRGDDISSGEELDGGIGYGCAGEGPRDHR